MREGRPAHVAYNTRFLINWPEHLGGGTVYLDLRGTMLLIPIMSFE